MREGKAIVNFIKGTKDLAGLKIDYDSLNPNDIIKLRKGNKYSYCKINCL